MTQDQIISFRAKLLDWFEKHQRQLPWRATKNPYNIWVAEVMLQQTQVKKVLDYYHRFLSKFPTIIALAQASVQQVLKAWEGLGYYARARHLHQAAQIIAENYDGKIPTTFKEFSTLPGAGNYITAAVLSQAFDAPYAVVDGNVKRVLARLLLIDQPVNGSSSTRMFLEKMDELLDHGHPGAFNQAMMELGAVVCRPDHPQCSQCPIASFCLAFHTGAQNSYPKSIRRRETPTYHIAVGVIHHDGHVLITRRPFDGLLGGLWEFPGGRLKPGESPEQACLRTIKEKTDLEVQINRFVTRVHHAYSHFKIIMDVFDCQMRSGTISLAGPAEYRWIDLSELKNFPLHVAVHKFMPLLKAASDD